MDHYLSSTAAPQNSLYSTHSKPLKVQKSESTIATRTDQHNYAYMDYKKAYIIRGEALIEMKSLFI
jgi:hypothetical protein